MVYNCLEDPYQLQVNKLKLNTAFACHRSDGGFAPAGIDRCYVVEKKPGEKGPAVTVQTDGINFEGAWANSDLVDVTAVTANDVGAVLRTFGVEAARATVVAEVSGVFGAYGIGVDPRHLSLISDHMTHQVGNGSWFVHVSPSYQPFPLLQVKLLGPAVSSI